MNPFPILFGTPWPFWPIIFAGAGAGYLTLRGYQRRAGEVKAPRLKRLKFLRISGWVLLFLCLLQPMRREYIREEKASRLTVLTDDSESMSMADKRDGATRIDRVKSVLLGDGSVAANKNSKEPQPPDKDALLSVLARSFKLQLEAFSNTSRTLAQGDVSESAKARAFVDEVKAQGESTDIAKALTESFGRLKGPDAGGLVLISDGGDTARGDVERAASLYKRAGTPIYVIGVGDPDVQDLAVTQVRCRRIVSKDTLVRVEVDVSRTGIPDGKFNVSIKRNGRVVGTPVVLDMKDATGTAVFEFLPDGQGFLEYEATVDPFPGEPIVSNNTMGFGLVAYSRKLRVLYMEGSIFVHGTYHSTSPGMYYNHPMQYWWETQFLENALNEDLDVEVDVLAKDEPPRDVSTRNELRMKTVKEAFPKTKKELYNYDVIISSDIPYNYFSEEQIQWTVDFVGKHGGGFVMVGGWTAFAGGGYAKTPIDKILPVEMLDETHVDNVDFNWRITDEAWSHPIMQIEKDDQKNKEAWAKLPAFHGFSKTTRPKPAAVTLAVVADDGYDTAYGPSILLAAQPFGNGRSMAFTSDCTGSWGTEWEDSWGASAEDEAAANRNKYYKTFWKNTVRWLAHYRMNAPNQLVTLESDRLVYGRGEQPNLRVKVMNEDYELTDQAKVQLSITGPDGRTQQVNVFPRYEEHGIYERKLEMGGVGRYEIEAVATLGKEEIGRDKAIIQVRPASAELRQLSQNVALLKRIAEQTGGKYLTLEKASELPSYLREATHVIEKHRDNDLWDRPWIFCLIIGLLCGEWFLRKRSGLP